MGARRLIPALVAAAALAVPGVASANTLLNEGFDSSSTDLPTGWTSSGRNPGDDLWHVQASPQNVFVVSGINPELVTLPDSGHLPGAQSTPNVAWFGDSTSGTFCGLNWADFNAGASKNGCTSGAAFNGDLTSAQFDLAGKTTAQLSFDAWYEVEAVDPVGHDTITVSYTTDSQTTPQPLGTINPVQGGGSLDQSYSNAGLEQSPVWKHYVVDLTPATGVSNVHVHFIFDSGDTNFQGFRGFAIDNVKVDDAFTSGPPQITSASACSDTGLGVLRGSNFVVGSQVLVDGQPTSTGVTGSDRVEYIAPAVPHTVKIVSPNNATSNSVAVQPAPCIFQSPPSTPPIQQQPSGPQELPPPVIGQTANAVPERGQVFVKLPAGFSAKYAWAHGAANKFIPLSQARQIPMGSVLDTRKGQVKLTTATLSAALQDGHFRGGLFNVKQARSNALTTLTAMGGNLNGCGTKVPKGGAAKVEAARKRRGRSLFSNVHGRFRTRGRNSSATVRGTEWVQKDSCAGTLTTVKRGTVVVQDFAKHRKVTLKKGRKYLARAPRKH